MKSQRLELAQRLFRWLALWGVIAFLAIHLIVSVPSIHNLLRPLWEHPNLSYAQKMQWVWGAYFQLMQFVQQQTPEDAILLLDPYFTTMDVYFLYPRQVIHGDKHTLEQHPEIQYVVINDRGFPAFPVEGAKIMLNEKLGLYKLR